VAAETGASDGVDDATARRSRALGHALAEYELKAFTITPERPLGEILSR
jgi:hypothetical protein